MGIAGLPTRSIVTLVCGHKRRVRNIKAYDTFYCVTCDDYHPIKVVDKEFKSF